MNHGGRSSSGLASGYRSASGGGQKRKLETQGGTAKRAFNRIPTLSLTGPLRVGGSGSSSRCFAKLKYCQTNQQISITAGAINFQSYRLNSLFDPYQTGVGHQPYKFDQITGMGYKGYVVHAVKVVIVPEGKANASAARQVCFWTEFSSDTWTIATTTEKGIERAHKWSFVERDPYGTNPGSVDKCTRMIKFYKKIKNILGLPKLEVYDKSDVGADPTRECYLNICAGDTANAATVDFYFTIIIKFYAEFFLSNPIAGS